MRGRHVFWKSLFVLTIAAVIVLGSMTLIDARGKPKLRPCPWSDLNCLDVWDPVTCDNGVTYSNACYALRACATGCTSGYPTW